MPFPARTLLPISIALIAAVAIATLPHIPQDPAYHHFADTQSMAGIPHFWNLVSNLGFVVVGLLGIRQLLARPTAWTRPWRLILTVFFAGVLLTGFGSAYYHWQPDNHGLMVDRLAMGLAFGGFLALVIGITRSVRVGARLLLPLVAIALGAVAYWYLSEMRGAGDLRPYILVQFLPLLLIPVLILSSNAQRALKRDIWWVLGAYTLSKLLELFDQQILDWTGLIGGHPLKHLAAALGTALILRVMQHPDISTNKDAT